MTVLSFFFSTILAFTAAQGGDAARGSNGFHVLAYHTFMGDKNEFSFSLQELDQHCDYLHKNGFTFISLNDLAQGKLRGNKNVLVTIDDGHRTVMDAYYKVLKKYTIRPLLGIYPNIIGKKDYALTWEQLRQLKKDGCDIAAHGYFHSFVNEKLYKKNKKAFMDEIYKSKKVLEEKLGLTVIAYIYPFGVRSPITIKTLREAGYRYAFTINNGFVSVPLRTGDVSLEIPRYMLTRKVNQSVLALFVRRSKKNIIVEKEPVPARKNRLTVNEKPAGSGHDYAVKPAVTLEPIRASLVDSGSRDVPARVTAGESPSIVSPEIRKEILEHVPGEKAIRNLFEGRNKGEGTSIPSFRDKWKNFYSWMYVRVYRYYSSYMKLLNSNLAGLEKKAVKFYSEFRSKQKKSTLLRYCLNNRSC